MIGYVANQVGRFGLNPKEIERFLKFAVVGTIGFTVDYGLLTLLVELVGMHEVAANVISFSAAVVSNFTFNRYWTYPDSRNKAISAQLGQFLVVSVIGLLINTGILGGLSPVFNHLLDTK